MTLIKQKNSSSLKYEGLHDNSILAIVTVM